MTTVSQTTKTKWYSCIQGRLGKKLLLLAAVPTVLVGILTAITLSDQWGARTLAKQSGELSQYTVAASALVHELQKERGFSAGFLASKGKNMRNEVEAQRRDTDAKLSNLQTYLESFDAE
ncbi:MAG: hypothetical protein GY801_06810, partial [bacterium]|nr:hypothetical protein [bacterium]